MEAEESVGLGSAYEAQDTSQHRLPGRRGILIDPTEAESAVSPAVAAALPAKASQSRRFDVSVSTADYSGDVCT